MTLHIQITRMHRRLGAKPISYSHVHTYTHTPIQRIQHIRHLMLLIFSVKKVRPKILIDIVQVIRIGIQLVVISFHSSTNLFASSLSHPHIDCHCKLPHSYLCDHTSQQFGLIGYGAPAYLFTLELTFCRINNYPM